MFLPIAAVAAASVMATPSPEYLRLVAALTAGAEVTVLVHFQQCTIAGTDHPGPAILGGARIDPFLIPNGQHVAFSVVHETLNAREERTTEFIRYRVMTDGKVTIRTASLAQGESKPSTSTEYACELGKGVSFVPAAR